jgi:tellurite resistance protein TerB
MFRDFVESLKQKTGEIKNDLLKFKNKDFMNGVAASCALVARADGNINDNEKQEMVKFIESYDALSVFKTVDVIRAFNEFLEQFEFSASIGEAKAMEAIGKFRGKEQQGRLIVRICIAIGTSDGDFDDDEKKVVRKICNELQVSPADFEL